MTGRESLKNRRLSETFDVEVSGLRYKATVSYFDDGGQRTVSTNRKAAMPVTSPRVTAASSSACAFNMVAPSKRSHARCRATPTARRAA